MKALIFPGQGSQFEGMGKNLYESSDQAKKIFEDRLNMTDEKIPINWGYAESMAYATLLKEGYPIRISGQDVLSLIHI